METSRCMRAPKLEFGGRKFARGGQVPAEQPDEPTNERDYLHVPIAQPRSESVPGRCPGVTYPYHLVLKRGIDEVVVADR
jgi:hypothetical protein